MAPALLTRGTVLLTRGLYPRGRTHLDGAGLVDPGDGLEDVVEGHLAVRRRRQALDPGPHDFLQGAHVHLEEGGTALREKGSTRTCAVRKESAGGGLEGVQRGSRGGLAGV